MVTKEVKSQQTHRNGAKHSASVESDPDHKTQPRDETNILLHELRVHQIELESQNEELRRAYAELDALRALYVDLYNRAPVGYFMLTQEGRIIEANLTAANLLGLSKDEMTNQPISRFIYKDDQDIYYLNCKQCDNTNETQVCELRMINKDEMTIWARLTATAHRNAYEQDDAGNRPIWPVYRIVINDMTDLKIAEEEKAKLENELKQVQKLESIGRLAGGVAHGLNNMLSIILGHVELAMDDLDTTHPLQDNLNEIRTAATRITDFTLQLQAFARVQPIKPRMLDLNETIDGMLPKLKLLVGESIHLNWKPGIEMWLVNMDVSQIEQIVTSLCQYSRNSITGVGVITIETGITIFDDVYCVNYSGLIPGEYVKLTVSDDGCGLDMKTLDHIFEPFYLNRNPEEKIDFGLSSVYGAVKQNNGYIYVNSKPDEGTEFVIYLPRYVNANRQTRKKDSPDTRMRGHETILLVEDEPAILDITTRILSNLGYEVLPASNPVDAIRLARKYADQISLLLTDVIMPEMNGLDLSNYLLSLYPDFKLMYMSGYTANIIDEKDTADKKIYFVQKPFSMMDLATKIREALDS